MYADYKFARLCSIMTAWDEYYIYCDLETEDTTYYPRTE